jgi:hypothetical protein
MPWILDGSNLAGGGDREVVRRAALAVARNERVKLLLYFDGPPPLGSASLVQLGTVEVRYVPHADAAILAHIATAGRDWIVATDDRLLGERVKALGARLVHAAAFWEKVRRGVPGRRAEVSSPPDVETELAYFRDDTQRLPAETATVRRRRPRR